MHAQRTLAGIHLLHLEGPPADQVADPGLDPVEPAEDHHRTFDARGHPPFGCLERRENVVESLMEIGEHMIVIERLAVTSVKRRSRSAHQNEIGNELLKSCGCGQDGIERGLRH